MEGILVVKDLNKHDANCMFFDACELQIGARAIVIGAYVEEWPGVVRIMGAIADAAGKVNITIGNLDGSEPTDGFAMRDLIIEPRLLNADRVVRLRDAAKELLDGAVRTYKARNGREMSIEAEDGEACEIVHSDLIHGLRQALSLFGQSTAPTTATGGSDAD